jgi:hypothetical protein
MRNCADIPPGPEYDGLRALRDKYRVEIRHELRPVVTIPSQSTKTPPPGRPKEPDAPKLDPWQRRDLKMLSRANKGMVKNGRK